MEVQKTPASQTAPRRYLLSSRSDPLKDRKQEKKIDRKKERYATNRKKGEIRQRYGKKRERKKERKGGERGKTKKKVNSHREWE